MPSTIPARIEIGFRRPDLFSTALAEISCVSKNQLTFRAIFAWSALGS